MSNRKKYYNEFISRAKAYLGGVCVVCGTEENLEFHHKDPATKLFVITTRYGYKWESTQTELDKCELLCTVHHKEKHATKHGELRMYNNGCRCDLCRTVWNAKSNIYKAKHRARIKAETTGV